MIENIIFFSMGYFFANLIRPAFKADMLLCWDSESFGWRPVANPHEISEHGRYIAAVEVDSKVYVQNLGPKNDDN